MTICVIETRRLQLRPVTVADAELMLAVWNDPDFIRNVSDRGIRTIADARQAIKDGPEKMFAEHSCGPYSLALKPSGQQIGICGLFRRDNLDCPDIGFALLPNWVGQGYAFEAAKAVLQHSREELGLDRVAAIVSPDNAPSIGLIGRLGMQFERPILMPGDEHEIELYSMAL